MTAGGAYTRSYFYARLVSDFDQLLDKKIKEDVPIWPDDKPIPMGDGTFIMPSDIEIVPIPAMRGIKGMQWGAPRTEEPIMAINIQERLNKMRFCPACGQELSFYPDDNQTRNCECGSFKLTEVHTNGDVVFEFHFLAQEDGPRP